LVEKNWAGTHEFAASEIHNPESIEQAQEIVSAARRIRPLGTRHSFNDIADGTGDLISLVDVAPDFSLDGDTVTVTGGTKYAVVATWLESQGKALHNMGSLPHISVAGATATGTHGSGTSLGNLSSAVRGLEFITPDGSLSTVRRGDADFAGSVVSLGALGLVSRITLAVQPSYQVRQDVFVGLTWPTLLAELPQIFAAGYSVSVFTTWTDDALGLWVKTRMDVSETVPDELFGAAREQVQIKVLEGEDNMTVQGGVPGPWSERLPHFRIDATPSNGDEIQTEYLVALTDAAAALEALRPLASRINAALHVTELRTVAADDLWLSTAYGRDSLCIHFTWKNLPNEVAALLAPIEEALAPFGARPHWGKVNAATAPVIAGLYEKLPDFRELAARRDPDGKFSNGYLDRVLGI
jgi:xylitol oxidase